MLVEKQEIVKSKIEDIFSQAKIKIKYKNVFNGFLIEDISEIEALQIESLQEAQHPTKTINKVGTKTSRSLG
jgi:hypothetical protein